MLPSLSHVIDPYDAGAMAARALGLQFAGVMGAVLARFIVTKASDTLHAVRESDLMGKYFLHESLGRGGMGEVFRATYSPGGGFQKTVAVKRIVAHVDAQEEFAELFLAEARIGATLAHPNVVQVFDVGKFRGEYILAMEFVDGGSLEALLKAHPRGLPIEIAAYVASELAGALEYIHGRIGPSGWGSSTAT